MTPELESVVLRALAKEPRERFADADEFIAALEAAASRIPSPRAIAAAEAAAAALPAAAAVGGGGRHGAAPAAAAAPPPRPVGPADRRPAGGLPPPRPPRRRPAGRGAAPARAGGRKRWPWIVLGGLVLLGLVLLLVSVLTPNRVTVPNVVGGSISTATNRLQSEGFEVETVRDNSDKPRNTVIGQNPGGGTVADEGSLVRITVSEGPPLANVPDVVGKGRLQARRTLTAAGFEVHETRSPSATVAINRVISQTPDGDSFNEAGGTVTIEVSAGPERVPVPERRRQDDRGRPARRSTTSRSPSSRRRTTRPTRAR